MKATNAYAAKRALIDRLTELSQVVGHPLEGVQVADAYPAGITDRCIYGGGARFVQDEGAAEAVLRHETVTTGLYVRVFGRDLDVRDTEVIAEGFADVIADELVKNPELADSLSFTQITAGSADFYPADDGVEAVLALSVDVESWLD